MWVKRENVGTSVIVSTIKIKLKNKKIKTRSRENTKIFLYF